MMTSITALLIGALGVLLVVGAHVGTRVSRRRAQTRYRSLMGDNVIENREADIWAEIRSYAGIWGCLTIPLLFLRVLGAAVACGAMLYLLFGGR